MDFNCYLAELNGYLRALQRISGPSLLFGAESACTSTSLEEAIAEKVKPLLDTLNLKYLGISELSYRELVEKIKYFIFQGGLSKTGSKTEALFGYLERVLIEDINEYYGLMSSSLNKDGVFHPLIKGPVGALDCSGAEGGSFFCFFVKIEDVFIFTYFCRRVSSS